MKRNSDLPTLDFYLFPMIHQFMSKLNLQISSPNKYKPQHYFLVFILMNQEYPHQQQPGLQSQPEQTQPKLQDTNPIAEEVPNTLQKQMQMEVGSADKENPEFKEALLTYQGCSYCQEYFLESSFQQHEQICQMIFLSEFNQKQGWNECELCKADLSGTTRQQHDKFCLMKEVQCDACGDYVIRCGYQDHTDLCPKLNQKCTYCFKLVKRSSIRQHQRSCQLTTRYSTRGRLETANQFEDIEFEDAGLKNTCKWCLIEINPQECKLQDHEAMCADNLELHQYLADQAPNLAPCQFTVLGEIYKTTVEQNFKSMHDMKSHIFQMNYHLDDLFLMRKYIQEMAPIIIHFNMSALSHFVKDTHYRNLFETNTSGGNKSKESRKLWERHLFGPHYDEALDSQRVKYGVMNFMNDHQGIARCKAYGSCFMVLGYSVRKRCTITHTRKYAPGEIIGTLKYNYPVLSRFSRKELQAIYYASQGYEVESKDLAFFKQIQIHGPIEFQRDVDCIYCPGEEILKNSAVVHEFMSRFKVPIKPIEEFDQQKKPR